MVALTEYRRVTQPPKGSFFLLGVRGAAKKLDEFIAVQQSQSLVKVGRLEGVGAGGAEG